MNTISSFARKSLFGIPKIIQGRFRYSNKGHSVGRTMPSEHHVRKARLYLADLKKGETAIVKSVGGNTVTRLHLMEMGLTPGTSVKVVRLAVFGGPLDIWLRGYRLSLRRTEAQAIELQSH